MNEESLEIAKDKLNKKIKNIIDEIPPLTNTSVPEPKTEKINDLSEIKYYMDFHTLSHKKLRFIEYELEDRRFCLFHVSKNVMVNDSFFIVEISRWNAHNFYIFNFFSNRQVIVNDVTDFINSANRTLISDIITETLQLRANLRKVEKLNTILNNCDRPLFDFGGSNHEY